MIRFENVGMRYGSGPEVLRDISFTLDAGSFHFLTGASGAGKSSLLKLLYLSHKPSRGLVVVARDTYVPTFRVASQLHWHCVCQIYAGA